MASECQPQLAKTVGTEPERTTWNGRASEIRANDTKPLQDFGWFSLRIDPRGWGRLGHPPPRESPTLPAKPTVLDLPALPGVPCPCGVARRAFADRDEFPGTVHLTEISTNAREHYHKEHTEIYIILACQPNAVIILDGEEVAVAPQNAILIPPGVRHRAVGQMTVLILCTPNFDPADEHFDDSPVPT